MLSCFYTKKEIAKRISILYSASLFSGAVSGLLATAITSGMNGKAGIAAWRWLFIIGPYAQPAFSSSADCKQREP